MTIYVDLDFETCSAADLPLIGATAYAMDFSTGVLVLRFEHEGAIYEWFPGDKGEEFQLLFLLALNPEVIFVAHNAGFEQAIWQHIMVPVFGLPPIPIERWEDTMATCAWKAIPLGLDRAGAVLGLPVSKDKEGRTLTLSMSKPETQVDHEARYPGPEWGTKAAWKRLHRKGMWPERTPERMARISRYCRQDVEIEAGMRKRIGLLSEQSPQERKIWIYDQKINQRGIRIDTDFVRAAQTVVAGASRELLTEFQNLTGGIAPTQVAKVIGWAADQGVKLDGLKKEYLETLIGSEDEGDTAGYVSNAAEEDETGGLPGGELPVHVRSVLRIRQMLGGAAVKKLGRMLACVCPDGRVRGTLQYHAASPGRWGGRLFQPQNFPRGVGLVHADGDKVPIPELVRAVLTGDHHECGQFFTRRADGKIVPVAALSMIQSCLRYALIPDPGKVFLVGDFAGIEARVVLALAGQHDRTREMAEKGSGVYLTMAEKIYKRRPGEWSATPELVEHFKKALIAEYTIGKNTVLGCGFQMGGKTFQFRYCQDQPLGFAEDVVNAYRKEWAPRVPKLWYALGDASLEAVRGKPTEAYGVLYKMEDRWLTAQLPSGWQKLWYYDPRLGTNRFGRDAWTYSTTTMGKWVNKGAYGGLLTENTVQALARGLLCASLDRLECNGMPVVLSVHDELVAEVDEKSADKAAFEQLMAEPTGWAKALRIPIAVEVWQGERYRK